jgi:lactate dehydrogenase-like 2-hydroxyacid dehydrogenase
MSTTQLQFGMDFHIVERITSSLGQILANRQKIVLTRRLPPAVEERAVRDYDAVLNPDDRILGAEGLIRAAEGAEALLICGSEKLTREVIGRLPSSVKIASTFSAGLDHIDLEAAREKGLRIGNTPDAVTIATAEIAMLLVLGAARRAPEGEALIRNREWVGWGATMLLGSRLDGKILGIYGMGKIGQALAKRARGFDMVIHYHNRRRLPAEEELGAVYHESLDSLLAVSQFLSLNAPSTPETQSIINAETIGRLPQGAIVVNTARGDLIVDEDLIAALKSGRIAYAGLDVFRGEPRIHEGYYALPNARMWARQRSRRATKWALPRSIISMRFSMGGSRPTPLCETADARPTNGLLPNRNN